MKRFNKSYTLTLNGWPVRFFAKGEPVPGAYQPNGSSLYTLNGVHFIIPASVIDNGVAFNFFNSFFR